jgi:uncharacterized protein (TIGR03000 family)
MTADQTNTDQDGILPEADAAESLRLMMRGSSVGKSTWRRLLPPSLCSVGFHFFFLSLVAVITVTFADDILQMSTWETAAASMQVVDESVGEIDFEPAAELERDYDVSGVEVSEGHRISEPTQVRYVPIQEEVFVPDPETGELKKIIVTKMVPITRLADQKQIASAGIGMVTASSQPETIQPKTDLEMLPVNVLGPKLRADLEMLPAHIEVEVPSKDAEVLFNGFKTQQKGTSRIYVTPPLNPTKKNFYELTVRWRQDQALIEWTRRVSIAGGGRVKVNFTEQAAPNDAPMPAGQPGSSGNDPFAPSNGIKGKQSGDNHQAGKPKQLAYLYIVRPGADAQIFFNGIQANFTTRTMSTRPQNMPDYMPTYIGVGTGHAVWFQTPPAPRSGHWDYRVMVRWTKEGKTTEDFIVVAVPAGNRIQVDFSSKPVTVVDITNGPAR